MDQRLYGYMKIYVDNIWPLLVHPEEDAVFIKDDGRAFKSATKLYQGTSNISNGSIKL